MMAILIISLSVAVPRVRESIQRDREVETMQRGKQYIRAIQLYYRKFHAYPPNVDALVKTNDIRFLRKKYIDPPPARTTGSPFSLARTRRPGYGILRPAPRSRQRRRHRPRRRNTGRQRSQRGIGSAGSAAGGGLFSSSSAAQRLRHEHGRSSPGGTDANGNPTPGTGTTGSAPDGPGTIHWLHVRLLQQPHRHRPDLRRRRHHRLLARKPQAVHPGLQKEKPLQRVGVRLRPADRQQNDGAEATPARSASPPAAPQRPIGGPGQHAMHTPTNCRPCQPTTPTTPQQ